MQAEHSWLQKIRFATTVSALYMLTIAFAWYVIRPQPLFKPAAALTKIEQKQHIAATPAPIFQIISGLPVRIVIPGSSYNGTVVDLPVDPGYYDSTTDSWTLSGYHAQFAMVSSLPNNFTGETYIYGHNNDSVFGALRHVTPTIGSSALLYTSNGHIFSYTFMSASSVAPDMTSVLDYSGPPIMTIQTCTGSFNEVRTLYQYSFDKVVQ
jgi:hypothetical protein